MAACGGGSCGSGTHCGACCGGACGQELILTQQEANVLLRLAQTPFLPVARRADWEIPAFREEPGDDGIVLLYLEQKRLVSLDYDLPLSNFSYAAYADCPIHGSVALTERGQKAVDLLEGMNRC